MTSYVYEKNVKKYKEISIVINNSVEFKIEKIFLHRNMYTYIYFIFNITFITDVSWNTISYVHYS